MALSSSGLRFPRLAIPQVLSVTYSVVQCPGEEGFPAPSLGKQILDPFTSPKAQLFIVKWGERFLRSYVFCLIPSPNICDFSGKACER